MKERSLSFKSGYMRSNMAGTPAIISIFSLRMVFAHFFVSKFGIRTARIPPESGAWITIERPNAWKTGRTERKAIPMCGALSSFSKIISDVDALIAAFERTTPLESPVVPPVYIIAAVSSAFMVSFGSFPPSFKNAFPASKMSVQRRDSLDFSILRFKNL